MGLVTLGNMKTYLGVTVNTYDAFLQEQIDLISEAVETYCGRKFLQATWTQTWYNDFQDFERVRLNLKKIILYHFPTISITSVSFDGQALDPSEFRNHKPTGMLNILSAPERRWDELVIVYSAGYAALPIPITHVVYQIVQERYNKKLSGVNFNFGTDVTSISIPGTIAVNFDYSLEANKKASAFGILLGATVNVLDAYRSERPLSIIEENVFVS